MPTIRISNTNVSKIQLPGKGQYCLYWDDQLAGFGVRALPSGLVYIVQRRIGGRDGRTVRVTVGKHGEISASKARDMAAEALANLRKGSDLNQIKQQEQKAKHIKALTLGQAYNEFIESRTLRPRTLQTYSYILNYTLSDWLNLPITDITAEMVLKKHKEISSSGIGGRGAGSANQVMRLLRTVFNYVISVKKDAMGKSIVSENPVKVLSSLGSWNKLQPRSNIVKVEDLQLWYETVMKLENEKMQDFFLFLMFSGLRRNEAACLQWKDVDTSTKILTIRAEISKTKIKRELPLPDILLNILKRRRAKIIVGNPYVFTDRKKTGHLTEPKKSVKFVQEKSGIKWSSHDLRRTYASTAAQLDISHHKLKHLLGHATSNDITSHHYVQISVDDLREPAKKISNFLKEKMGMAGNTRRQAHANE